LYKIYFLSKVLLSLKNILLYKLLYFIAYMRTLSLSVQWEVVGMVLDVCFSYRIAHCWFFKLYRKKNYNNNKLIFKNVQS